MNSELTAIPVVDVRDGGPLRHARQSATEARALRDACLEFFPRGARPLVPVLDAAAQRWLQKSRSPYVPEIAQIAAELKFSGIWMLNASYQWGCTARALERDGALWLIRTLDWPFKGLGRHVAVTQMQGACGNFFNVTWPGYVGVLTAMAPGRFAASVNQAPLWRRTWHRWLRSYDMVLNALSVWAREDDMPSDQLLRRAFETCPDYASARRMLETTPVSRPVIYALAGCRDGERCIIERTETGFVTREQETSAANDWVPARSGWEGRIGVRRFFTSSFEDATDYSRRRRDTLAAWNGVLSADRFDWLREPVLNPYTRLAVAMCPARGRLHVAGYDLAGAALPERVTQACAIDTAPAAA